MRKYKNVTTTEIGHSLYNIWKNMKCRCYDSNCKRYSDYGGRGIVICNDWLEDFDCFADWAKNNGYTDELTIERIDVNGNYEPNNCCWITLKEQARNKRDTLKVIYKGVEKPLMQWCEELGLCYDTMNDRIVARKWSVQRAFETKSQIEISFAAKCKLHNINPATVRDRIVKFGWSEEEALNTPTLGRGANAKSYGRKAV